MCKGIKVGRGVKTCCQVCSYEGSREQSLKLLSIQLQDNLQASVKTRIRSFRNKNVLQNLTTILQPQGVYPHHSLCRWVSRTHPQWEQAQCPTSVNSCFCHFTTSHGVHMSHNKPQNKVEPIICLPNEVKVSINIVLEYNLEVEIIQSNVVN